MATKMVVFFAFWKTMSDFLSAKWERQLPNQTVEEMTTELLTDAVVIKGFDSKSYEILQIFAREHGVENLSEVPMDLGPEAELTPQAEKAYQEMLTWLATQPTVYTNHTSLSFQYVDPPVPRIWKAFLDLLELHAQNRTAPQHETDMLHDCTPEVCKVALNTKEASYVMKKLAEIKDAAAKSRNDFIVYWITNTEAFMNVLRPLMKKSKRS